MEFLRTYYPKDPIIYSDYPEFGCWLRIILELFTLDSFTIGSPVYV